MPARLTGVTAVAAGMWHSLALRSDGTVVAWGREYAGPARVPAELREVTAIAAGGGHVVALATTSYTACAEPGPAAGRTARAGIRDFSYSSGDGGPATSAGLVYPKGLARAGDGTLVMADTLSSRIRRVDPVTNVITTIAGTGARGYGGDGGPAAVAVLTCRGGGRSRSPVSVTAAPPPSVVNHAVRNYLRSSASRLLETYGQKRPSDGRTDRNCSIAATATAAVRPADAVLMAMSWLLVGPDEPPGTPTSDNDMR